MIFCYIAKKVNTCGNFNDRTFNIISRARARFQVFKVRSSECIQ